MQKLEGPEHVVFTPLAIIYKLLRFIITNVFPTGSNLTSKITSSMLWIFSIFPSNTSFSTKVIIINFIVLSIMQETCNTYILAGVDGSSNVGSRRNESFATDHQHTEKTGKILVVSIRLICNAMVLRIYNISVNKFYCFLP